MYKKVKPRKRFHRSEVWFDWVRGKADEKQGAGNKDHRGWFHTNIGGGSWIGPVEECNLENLSTIAFSWMLDQIKGHASVNEQVISQEQIDRERQREELNQKRRKTDLELTSMKTRPKCWAEWVSIAETAVAAIKLPIIAIKGATEDRIYENS